GRDRPPARPRQPRALGPQARRAPGAGAHERAGGQGGRDRPRARDRAPSRLAGARRDLLRRGHAPLRAPHQQRGRHRGRHVERRAGGGAHGLQAALDPDEPAALRRHRHQGRGQGRHRALRRGRDSRCGGDRRGGGGLRARGRLPREVRRRLARRDPPQPGRLPRARAELLGVPQVILTGFMATGKTEVGRRLARRLGRPFVDIDGLVEAASGKKVAELFASDGEARFRQLERAAVAEACLVPEAVIATGGGTLLDPENRRRLAASGPIVCLAASPEEILRRVGDPGSRPLLADGSAGGRCALVTSERVGALYREPVLDSLRAAGFAPAAVAIPDGEEQKNLASLAVLYDRLLEAGIERRSPLVALGGGVVTDLAGFAAATLLRGLPTVLLPTTLLAQIDAAIGGKTGVNHALGKNLIGAFHQPRLVLADVDTLATLPRRELLAGVAEVIKTAAIGDAALFGELEEGLERVIGL